MRRIITVFALITALTVGLCAPATAAGSLIGIGVGGSLVGLVSDPINVSL
ncbi:MULTISPECIES: hypothetical protein [unclassified Nocardiopsis]|nr:MULTISPECIES: hypothetical protein [unclassified Nocardiopsis]MBQ1084394.1 hypothetical protein [Nocardiopsis sp. B62]